MAHLQFSTVISSVNGHDRKKVDFLACTWRNLAKGITSICQIIYANAKQVKSLKIDLINLLDWKVGPMYTIILDMFSLTPR